MTPFALPAGVVDAWINPNLGNLTQAATNRFALSHVVDPRDGMRAVRLVEELVADGYRLIRLLGLQTQLHYNDAAYYPIYAKCVELGVPVSVNLGNLFFTSGEVVSGHGA